MVALLKVAVQEAFQVRAESVGALHILIGLLVNHPELFLEATDLSYYKFRHQILLDTERPDQQSGVQGKRLDLG